MAEMKLNAEVFIRIDGHEELHNIGTIEVPINVTFGDKPTLGHKPGYRGVEMVVNSVAETNRRGR